MSVSYNKLWKLMIDKDMSKSELINLCEIPSGTMNKLRNNVSVHMKILERICIELNCNIEDIVEIKRDTSN